MFILKPDGSREPVSPGARLDELERRNKHLDDRLAGLGFLPVFAHLDRLHSQIARIEQARLLLLNPVTAHGPHADDSGQARSFFIDNAQPQTRGRSCACHFHH